MPEREIQSADSPDSLTEEKDGSISEPVPETLSLWTPAFMLLFALVCIVGLSAASLLTQGWLNGYYSGESILLGYLLIVAGLWLLLFIRNKFLHLRIAALFGLTWVFCMGCMLLLTLLQRNGVVATPHLSAAASLALLGSFLCLSFNAEQQDRWERWFLRLAPLVLLISIPATFLLGQHNIIELEASLSGVTLCLCIATWWLRPLNWRKQPLPAFLFGLIPLIQLLFNFPHRGETNFFYTQVIFLILILGLLRIIQKELRFPR